MRDPDEIDRACAEITQWKATCQRLEAENAEGQRRTVELEAINAELLAALVPLTHYFEPLEVGELIFPQLPELRQRVEAARATIAKAKEEKR